MNKAPMMESVDIADLKSAAKQRTGSSPVGGTIHLQPITFNVRVYIQGRSYEYKDKYKAVCTVQALGDLTMFISGFHGQMSREDWAEMAKVFYSLGFRYALAERRGGLKQYLISRFL